MSTGVRILIADDEPVIREGLRAILRLEPDVEIIGECRDGLEALEMIRATSPDVVFLDVQMPVLTGLEVIEQLGAGERPHVIFVTAHDEYAIRAFEVSAVDYVLKPFNRTRALAALRRAQERLRNPPAQAYADHLASLVERVSQQRYTERLLATSAGRIQVFPVGDIEWIEAADNYLRLHGASGQGMLRETMKGLEGKLDPSRFARVHRSTIVNLACVRELRPLPSGDYSLLLQSGASVVMSRSYRHELMRRLG